MQLQYIVLIDQSVSVHCKSKFLTLDILFLILPAIPILILYEMVLPLFLSTRSLKTQFQYIVLIDQSVSVHCPHRPISFSTLSSSTNQFQYIVLIDQSVWSLLSAVWSHHRKFEHEPGTFPDPRNRFTVNADIWSIYNNYCCMYSMYGVSAV